MLFAKGQMFVADEPITILAVAAHQEHWYRPGPRYKIRWGTRLLWISELVLCRILTNYVRILPPVGSITLDLKIG